MYKAGDDFTFEGPPDLVQVPTRGIDSFVGEYRSPTMKISFDFGLYSAPLEDEGVRKIIVNGESAKLLTKPDHVEIYFPELKSGNKLSMEIDLTGANPKDAEKLLLSIRFQ